MAKNAGYNYREAEDICAVAFVFLPKAARRTPKVVLIWYEVFRIYVVAEDKYIKIMHLG